MHLFGNTVAGILSCGWWYYGQFCHPSWSAVLVQTGSNLISLTYCYSFWYL